MKKIMVKFTEEIPENIYEAYCRKAKINKKEAYLILKGVGEKHGSYGMYHAIASVIDPEYDKEGRMNDLRASI